MSYLSRARRFGGLQAAAEKRKSAYARRFRRQANDLLFRLHRRKNRRKMLSGRQTPSLLLCCGNTHRQEPSARPRQASEAYDLIPMCVKEFFRARVRRLAGGVCLSDATTKKRRPRQEAEDLLLTMRLDGHQVKIAYTAEPCCRSHCIPYSIFRQPFALYDHSPIF